MLFKLVQFYVTHETIKIFVRRSVPFDDSTELRILHLPISSQYNISS